MSPELIVTARPRRAIVGAVWSRHRECLAQPGVVEDPGMCGSSLFGNREVSGLARGWTPQVRIGKARSRNR
jgi:hypothetical protein